MCWRRAANRAQVIADIEQSGGVLSEFYAQRRTSIKDGVGLIAFIVGWFAAAPIAWPLITAGFDDGGNAAMGVLKFVMVVFAVGIAFGALGLLTGAAAGMAWERLHRRRRNARPARPERGEPASPAVVTADAARKEPRATFPPLRYENVGVTVTDYLALLRLASSEEHDARRAAPAFARTTNIGAWDDGVLVGVARVLTDGYFYAALADIVVHPEHRRRGVGRALLNRAYDATPRGTLFVNARQGSAGFFEHVGCERGTPGFVMRRTSLSP